MNRLEKIITDTLPWLCIGVVLLLIVRIVCFPGTVPFIDK